ncbi:MAG: NFACT family protein [Spirochaetes bacterium]|nr:NFACT family protein [Spirochaetota bacterium]
MPPASSLNWREIDLVLSELDLAGCLVQEIHQPSHDRIVLDLFRPRAGAEHPGPSRLSLLVSLSSRYPRLHAIAEQLPNPSKPLRFAMFLRAHVKGGRIESARQVEADRIVRVDIARGDERKTLWIRLWSSAANLIATDAEGVILDAFYRRPKRGEVSGGRYTGPVPGGAGGGGGGRTGPAREYAVRDLAGEGTFNERLERHYRDLETSEGRENLAAEVDAELSMREAKLAATLAKLEKRLAEYSNVDRYRELGDLLTSSLHLIAKGDRWLRTEDWFHDNATIEIELVPGLTPAQNAEVYYERHRKARDGLERVKDDIAGLRRALAEVEAERARLASSPDLEGIRQARKAAIRPRSPAAGPGAPGLVFASPPYRILVGRSAKENDELLRRHVRGNDWWFHCRDYPGAYVFVKAPAGKSPPLETMLDAANLALHFSRAKASGAGDIYYTRVKHLRRAKGGPKGLVLPTQEKNLHVRLDPARIERLKAGTGG